MNNKPIFEKGDKVYQMTLGWNEVIEFLRVDSKYGNIYKLKDNKYAAESELSFTKYNTIGLSHERPIDYTEWYGKWCKFWNEDRNFTGYLVIRKFGRVDEMKGFRDIAGTKWDYVELLTEEQIKILNLNDKTHSISVHSNS